VKKLKLLPLLFIVFACSSDEINDDSTNTLDPIIGTWEGRDLNDLKVQMIVTSDNWTFISSDPEIENSTIQWRNMVGEPDYNTRTQTYQLIIDGVEYADEIYTLTFSQDFNTFLFEEVTFYRQ